MRYTAEDFKRARGVNFIPSYARNAIEIWRRYDPDWVDRELHFAEGIGFNSVRIWLHATPYLENPSAMLLKIEDCLNRCLRYGLTAIPVLFDRCGVEPSVNQKIMTAKEAYDSYMGDPNLAKEAKIRLEKEVKRFATELGKDILIPFTPGRPDVIFWQWWTPNPGRRFIDDELRWIDLKKYAEEVVIKFADHEAILVWDVHNEPALDESYSKFVRETCTFVKSLKPQAPITIGSAFLGATRKFAEDVDVLSFHTYAYGEELKKHILEAKKFAKETDKNILLTECLGNVNKPADEEQFAHYRENVPILLASEIGWYSWGLVVGNLFGSYGGIVYPDGFRRPAAVYLEKQLKTK